MKAIFINGFLTKMTQLNLKLVMAVASRAGYDGTEYLFVAEDLPREGAPEMPKHEV